MKNIVNTVWGTILILLVSSCASSNTTTVSNGVVLSQYKYVVFGTEEEGDAELADILLVVQNAISEKFKVVNPQTAMRLLYEGEHILSPKISAKSEKWKGGHTYISISFYDYDNHRCVAVVKSRGIGMTISGDQRIALKAIKKELDKTFPATIE